MELKEGMYIRTNHGIAKISKTETCCFVDGKECIYVENKKEDDLLGFLSKIEDILKASYSLIDLIEVGDYVNGVEIEQILDGKLWFDASDMRECCIKANQIKSIVTKEQFESMSYKVGK